MPFSIVRNDITRMTTDAVVNAANSGLAPGGGVCGAIFTAAGYEKMEQACRAIGRCPVGQAVATRGFALPAQYVIHAVGPIWQGGDRGEAELLASCYRSCLSLAAEHGIRTVDFSSISTGVYRYPLHQAAAVALRAIMDFLSAHDLPERVRMVCHTEETAAVYRQTWNLWYAGTKAERL